MRVSKAWDRARCFGAPAVGKESTPLDVIEKAIRSAFDKGNAADQAFREKVYRQAFAALDRVLQANPGVTVEAAMRRRKALQAKIVEIEQEYLPRPHGAEDLKAPLPPLPHSDAPAVEIDRGGPAPEARPASAPEAPKRAEERVEPVLGDAAPAPRPAAVEPEQPAPTVAAQERRAGPRPRRRLSRFASFFVAATLFSAIAIGIWWANQTGLLGSTEGPEPVAVEPTEPEDFEPGADQAPVPPAQAAADRDWIPVFGPRDVDSMSAPSDATAELMSDDDGDFVRIRSGGSGSAILFDVGQGVLERIAGKKATFDIVARAEDGKDTQMSVLCNFGELGDCGRKRYAVGNARADYLFELDVPDKRPGAGGTIAINSDFDNAGKSVDIFEIRVAVDE